MIDRRAVATANAARADLVDRIGADHVLVGEAARRVVGLHDGDGPVAVVRPRTPQQVIMMLKVGRARHLPVLVRSALPMLLPEESHGALVLDARGLDRPPAIDISRRVVTTGAGVDVAAVDRAARQARLCLRGVPALRSGETVGALLGAGEPGELGLGDGSLACDVVSALVVGGAGRVTQIGGPTLLGMASWPTAGIPDPLPLLVGSEGQMAVLCEVTLRLHRAPHVAWAESSLPIGRDALLQALSAARLAISRRLVDTVLLDEGTDDSRLHVRAATWRGVDDLAAVMTQASLVFGRHDIEVLDWRGENRRVRLGHQEGEWPRAESLPPATLDLRMSWADAAKVLDVSDALCAGADDLQVARSWAMGADQLRLRHLLGPGRPDRHPLVLGVRHLIDAGALPIGLGSQLRDPARARMGSATKVLLAGLQRAWDPDGVIGPRSGLL